MIFIGVILFKIMEKTIIRLTESELYNIVKKSVINVLRENRFINEDGEIGGGGAAIGGASATIGGAGATNCVGINVGGAAGQAKNHIDAAPFSTKPLKQKHNLGNTTTEKANGVDITPALDRTPGFSVGERVGGKKKK